MRCNDNFHLFRNAFAFFCTSQFRIWKQGFLGHLLAYWQWNKNKNSEKSTRIWCDGFGQKCEREKILALPSLLLCEWIGLTSLFQKNQVRNAYPFTVNGWCTRPLEKLHFEGKWPFWNPTLPGWEIFIWRFYRLKNVEGLFETILFMIVARWADKEDRPSSYP